MSAKTNTKPTAATKKQVDMVRSMQAAGEKFSEQVAKSGLTAGQVDRIVYVDRAMARLDDVAVTGISEPKQFWMGAPTLEYLHDAPFAALANLTRDADLTYTEWKPVCDAALVARSDDAAVAVITAAAAADGMPERIAGIKAGTWKRPAFGGPRKATVEGTVKAVATMSDAEREALLTALHAMQDLAPATSAA
jgi:hypothetical protein